MKLTCDACDTSFSVPDSAMKPEGRKVKCSKCGYVWIAKLENSAPKPEEKPDAKLTGAYEGLGDAADEMGLKAIASMLSESEEEKAPKTAKKPLKVAGKYPHNTLVKRLILLAVLGVLVAGMFAFKKTLSPVLSPLYDMLGMVTTESLVIKDLAYQKITDAKKDRFVLSGNILNSSHEPQTLPTLRISLQDESRESFYFKEFDLGKELGPNETYPFATDRIETAFKDKAKYIIVEIGNSYELNAR